MTDKEIDEFLKNFKTHCCNANLIKKGRATILCSQCKSDMTLEVVLLVKHMIKEKSSK